MAEISADSPKSPSSNPSSSSSINQRSTKPGTKRLTLTLSVFLSFLAGLPFLLKSTNIHRSPLPSSIPLPTRPPSFPLRFHAVFVSSSPLSPPRSLSSAIYHRIRQSMNGDDDAFEPLVTAYSLSFLNFPGGAGKGVDVDELIGDDDEAVDELLGLAIGGGGGGGGGRAYSVMVVIKEEEEVRVVVGKHRHAWIVGKVSENDAIEIIGEIVAKLFISGGREEGEVATEGKGEFMPVGLDGSVLLSFSLLNANPNDWVYDWEMQKIDKLILAPVIEALTPMASISIESQVLYHTPKSSMSRWDAKLGSHVFSTQDLPFFVNSNEWHLDTSIAAAGRSKVLQFVVYVPSAHECPLRLRLPNGDTSKTNGFISPMWGGVVIWNPSNCSRDSQMTQRGRNMIPSEEMQKIFEVFIGQIRLLFGFKSDYSHVFRGHKFSFLPSKRGFTEWELDVLYRRHASSNLLSSASTLESLTKLVQSLPRMIVTDEIGKQVKLSLEAAGLAQNNASLGVYDAAAASSRNARALAEDAFFHPSIMSISYSSIEHYFAIYMPFFAPVSLHVLLAAVKEIKRYRTEKAKHLSFVVAAAAGQAKASKSVISFYNFWKIEK